MSNYRKTMADALREMYPLDEETQLDEATMSSSQIARLKKAYEPMRDKKISPSNADKLSAMMDKVGKDKEALIQLFKADIPFVSQSAVTQLITKHDMKGAEINKLREEVDLDEVYQVYVKSPTAKSGWIAQGQPHKTEASAKKDAKNAGGVIKIVKEEVDLKEAKYELYHKDFSSAMQHAYKSAKKLYGITIDPEEIDSKVATGPSKPSEGKTNSYRLKGDKGGIQVQVYNKGGSKPFELNMYKEEVDLDEGKMSQLHQYMQDKKSPEEIAKLMKLDVKTIKALMSSHHPEDVDESAASDARRAISKDKDLRRGKDSADDDDFASADDVKGASKNIIMQLRKAGNRASQGVEFGDGKKVQIPAQMAIAVQQKYNAMKKPVDKEKFQARIAKSYKDMLSALKEELQPKKESILERMNRKIKENKHG
jgi:hypothetical protein